MGSYRIEESPNKRAGCSATLCKKRGIKIQKGEIRLGVWIDTEKFQSWTWRHWGCVTPKVLANIADAIEEDFALLDGLEDLPAEAQAKVRKAIEDGELDEADKTVLPLESAAEDASNGADKLDKKPAEKTKAETKTKTKKRSRADSKEAEEPVSKNGKKANGRAAVKEEKNQVEQPSKRRKARKATEEAVEEPEKPARKARGRKKKTDTIDDEDEVASHEEEVEAKPLTKKARGKQTAANGEKSKRARPKRKAADDE